MMCIKFEIDHPNGIIETIVWLPRSTEQISSVLKSIKDKRTY